MPAGQRSRSGADRSPRRIAGLQAVRESRTRPSGRPGREPGQQAQQCGASVVMGPPCCLIGPAFRIEGRLDFGGPRRPGARACGRSRGRGGIRMRSANTWRPGWRLPMCQARRSPGGARMQSASGLAPRGRCGSGGAVDRTRRSSPPGQPGTGSTAGQSDRRRWRPSVGPGTRSPRSRSSASAAGGTAVVIAPCSHGGPRTPAAACNPGRQAGRWHGSRGA